MTSLLDRLYARQSNSLLFFKDGWGDLSLLQELHHVGYRKGLPRTIEIAAKYDAYIPRTSAEMVHTHWPGSTMRWLESGHVGAFLFHRRDFLAAIRDAFARLGKDLS